MQPNLAVFFTDGNPTAWTTSGTCEVSTDTDGCPNPIGDGPIAANCLKLNGTRIFGLGFPNQTVNTCNMQLVSGRNKFNSGNRSYDNILTEADFEIVNNTAQLNAAFAAISSALTVPCKITADQIFPLVWKCGHTKGEYQPI